MNEEKDFEEVKEDFAYKNVLENGKNKRAWSAASLGVGILSLILFFIPAVSIIFGIVSVALAVISRRILGYFENLAIGGLVVGIFGGVFGVAFAIADFFNIFANIF